MTSAIQGGVSRDIAFGIAVTLLFFALALNLPVIGFFLAAFIPLPVLFYRVKLGRRTGAWVAALAALAMTAVLGKVSLDTLFYMELVLLGFVLGETLLMNLTIEKTLLYTLGTVLGTSGAVMLLYGMTAQGGIVGLISDYVLQSLKLTLAIYEKIGISPEAIRLISDSIEQIQYVLVRILPALAASASLFVAWANLMTARTLLLARGLFFPDFGRLNLWKAPDVLVWGMIASGILLLLPSKGVKVIGLNGLIVLMGVYFLEGIAIVSFYFEKKRLPRPLRWILYLFIFMQQIACLLVIALGFFDTWLNFRKIKTPPQESESQSG